MGILPFVTTWINTEIQKMLKSRRKNQQITYTGILISLSAEFSAESLQARRKWQDIFKMMLLLVKRKLK